MDRFGDRHRPALPALTGIRFLAAMYVVVYHFAPSFEAHHHVPGPIAIFLNNGYLSVPFFFMLSGFILAYTYDGQIERMDDRVRFWEGRFARIYPVYLLSLALSYWFTGRALSLTKTLAVLGMVQAWNPWDRQMSMAWNFPAWSLSVEAFFYICFPFIFPIMSRIGTRTLYSLAVALFTVSVVVNALKNSEDSPSVGGCPLPVMHLPEFLLGGALALIFLRSASDKPAQRPLRTYAAVAGLLAALSLPLGVWSSLVMLPFALLVYDLALGASRLSRIFSTPTMVLLGGASYAVYLLQTPVRQWTHLLFSYVPAKLAGADVVFTALTLVGFSIFVYLFWEEPWRKVLRPRFATRRQRMLASARRIRSFNREESDG
jgi:peptidoglycan/LPS O-acetylase OafA/YrhL